MKNILDTRHVEWTTLKSVNLDTHEGFDQLFADTVRIRKDIAEEFTADNALEARNIENFISLCDELITGESLDKYKENLKKVDRDTFENFCCNDTIYTKSGKNDDFLIINIISTGNMDTKYFFPHTSFRPVSILKMDIPVICVSEDPTSTPYWLSPPNMIGGNGAVNREEMLQNITRLAKKISKCKKVVVLGDCRNVAGALSIANELDFVTHAFLLNGLTTLVPEKLEFPVDEDESINPWMTWTYIKGYELLKTHGEERVDPFKHIREGLDVHYWYGKYDDEFMHFKDYASKYIDNIHEIDFKLGNNVHYVMPYWDRHILPKFISDLIVKS